MRRVVIIFLLGSVMLLSGCVHLAHGGPPTIQMAGSNFVGNTNFTIKIGDSITFSDTAEGGGSHILATGSNGSYAQENGAPNDLNMSTGVTFSPGDVKKYTFTTAGTYHITCKIHSTMNMTVVVS